MTNKKQLKKLLSVVMSFVLVASFALSMTGCTQNNSAGEASTVEDATQNDNTFVLIVTDANGVDTEFNVACKDTKTVGEALCAMGLISGDEGEYGLYVKSVYGINADYEKDGAYWAFYINGELSDTGVDKTEIVPGSTYSFVYTKA